MTDAAQAEGTPVPAETQPAETEVETQPETTEQTAESTDEVSHETTEDSSGDETPKPDQAPKKSAVQERISQLTRRAKEAEARVKELEEANALTAQPQEEAKPRPTLEQFDYDQPAYEAALLEWTTEQTTRSVQAAMSQQERNRLELARKQANDAAVETFRARSIEFAEQHPDFQSVIANTQAFQSEAVSQAIVLAENGPALAYHLATNAEKASEINGLPPGLAMMELGKLSAQLAAPPSPRTTKTPQPVPTVAPTGTTEPDFDSMSGDEYLAYHLKGRK